MALFDVAPRQGDRQSVDWDVVGDHIYIIGSVGKIIDEQGSLVAGKRSRASVKYVQ